MVTESGPGRQKRDGASRPVQQQDRTARAVPLQRTEPRNPLYFLLLLVGVVFVMTALAYAIIPVLEDKAASAGSPAPPSALREALRRDGWRWLLYEVAALIVVGIASMMLDRYRSLAHASDPGRQGEPPRSGGGLRAKRIAVACSAR